MIGVGGSWAGKILESSHALAWCYHCNRAEEKIQNLSSNSRGRKKTVYYLVPAIQHIKILSSINEPSWLFAFFSKWKQYLKSRWTRLGHLPTRVETSRNKKKKSLLNEKQDKEICYQYFHLPLCCKFRAIPLELHGIKKKNKIIIWAYKIFYPENPRESPENKWK